MGFTSFSAATAHTQAALVVLDSEVEITKHRRRDEVLMRRESLQRRLGPYWMIEMSCAVLIPFVVFRSAPPRTVSEATAVGVALFAVALLLLVGGAYWYGVLKRAQGNASLVASVLRIADAIERPVIALLGVSWLLSAVALAANGWTRAVIAALACSALGSLEYVNYFRVQLQHFDHMADFKRLLSGRGFRRAHLARDLAGFRELKTKG